jgi:hypothetical protein
MLAELGMVLADPGDRLADRTGYTRPDDFSQLVLNYLAE